MFNQRKPSILHGRNYTEYSSNTGFKEKHNIGEKRMLRFSFDQIKDMDPLSIRKKYVNADYQFQDTFYTTCASIPIALILGFLFYSLWFISPKSQNLRMYQQDIFDWNNEKIAEKMNMLEFNYEITPGKKTSEPL